MMWDNLAFNTLVPWATFGAGLLNSNSTRILKGQLRYIHYCKRW